MSTYRGSNFPQRLLVVLIVCLGYAQVVLASSSVSATKDCSLGPPCTATPASFSISTNQTITWEANYLGSGTQGRGFYIHHTSNTILDEIALSTSLASGFNTGTRFLTPGSYDISINYFGMGPGSYTITFNQTASVGISPT